MRKQLKNCPKFGNFPITKLVNEPNKQLFQHLGVCWHEQVVSISATHSPNCCHFWQKCTILGTRDQNWRPIVHANMVEKNVCFVHLPLLHGLRILLLRASPVLPSGVTHLSLGGLPHMLHHATCHMPHMNHQDPLQIQCNYLFPHIAHLAGPDEALAGMLHLNVCHLSSPPNNTGPRCICLPCRAIGNMGHIVDIHTQKSFPFLWKFTGKHTHLMCMFASEFVFVFVFVLLLK